MARPSETVEEWRERQRLRNRAYYEVYKAIERGDLVRPELCERCDTRGNGRIEAAHSDYTKPLEIEWLCQPCHRREDRARPKGGSRDFLRERTTA